MRIERSNKGMPGKNKYMNCEMTISLTGKKFKVANLECETTIKELKALICE